MSNDPKKLSKLHKEISKKKDKIKKLVGEIRKMEGKFKIGKDGKLSMTGDNNDSSKVEDVQVKLNNQEEQLNDLENYYQNSNPFEQTKPQQPMPQQPMPQQPMPRQPMPRQPMPQQPMPRQPMPRQPVEQYADIAIGLVDGTSFNMSVMVNELKGFIDKLCEAIDNQSCFYLTGRIINGRNIVTVDYQIME